MNTSINIGLNIFSVVLLLSGFVMLFISGLIYLKLNKDVRTFAYVMLAVAVWVIGEGLIMGSSTLPEMLFWTRVEYTGISFLPAFWIIAIIRLVNKEKWLTSAGLILIFLIPFLTWVIVLTDEIHHLYYSRYWVDRSGPFPLMAVAGGPWYKVHTLNFYCMLTLGLYLLISPLNMPTKFSGSRDM